MKWETKLHVNIKVIWKYIEISCKVSLKYNSSLYLKINSGSKDEINILFGHREILLHLQIVRVMEHILDSKYKAVKYY